MTYGITINYSETSSHRGLGRTFRNSQYFELKKLGKTLTNRINKLSHFTIDSVTVRDENGKRVEVKG